MKSLEILEKQNPEFADQVRKIHRKIESLQMSLDRKLASQAIINLTLSNRIQKLEKEGGKSAKLKNTRKD